MDSQEKTKLFIAGIQSAGLYTGQAYHDLKDESPAHIWEAEQRFDESKGMKPGSYIFQSGYYAGLKALSKCAKTPLPFDPLEHDSPIPFADPCNDGAEFLMDKWGLTHEEKQTLKLFIECNSVHKVAPLVGKSHETVRQTLNRAKTKARASETGNPGIPRLPES